MDYRTDRSQNDQPPLWLQIDSPISDDDLQRLCTPALHLYVCTGFEVKLETVPRAVNRVPLDFSLTERSTLVWTIVFDGVELPSGLEHSDVAPVEFHDLRRSVGKVGACTDLEQSFGHVLAFTLPD